MAKTAAMTETDTEELETDVVHRKSLASSFVVEISKKAGEHVWALTPIDKETNEKDLGIQAWNALHDDSVDKDKNAGPSFILKCRRHENQLILEVTNTSTSNSNDEEPSADLLFVLARVSVQHALQEIQQNGESKVKEWTLVFSSEINDKRKEMTLNLDFTVDDIRELFEVDENMEMVDMVDREGTVLGMVPRNVVHSLNLLHRGIGLTVSKDSEFSELYVHRRTDDKRIFPSLYDMFVGGVSLTGEDSTLTAKREVAEELGLTRALEESSPLSEPLFTCVVCTSYNRCVVTVYRYTMDPSIETISWQEEEVAWGEFVPCNIVEAAADLSIQRLAEKKAWPGAYPVIQSKWKGSKPPNDEYKGGGGRGGDGDWETWDFVPDGLLVWEAWLKWRESTRALEPSK
jgi:isopentenyldiphosphate isomerase